MNHLRVLAVLAALLLGLTACGPLSDLFAEPTSAPTATPEPTPEPTATPVPAGDPLTGADDADYANRRPVAVTLRTLTGAQPWWGIADAEVVVAGVAEGHAATLLAMYPSVDRVPGKVGPVGPGRDLTLQLALPANAIPVHINKNIYASNLLNVLTFQDLDGYNTGKNAFAFDDERYAAGFREENCWYTSPDLLYGGLSLYGMDGTGENQPMFDFAAREAPANQNGTELEITFSGSDMHGLYYDSAAGNYIFATSEGQVTDANSGSDVRFTNVFVLYASSGIKDDGYTRQYDLSGGTGLYLTGGAWEQINWSKEDATAPLLLTDMNGGTLTVNPGRSYIAVWGGYYGQGLRMLAADGTEQTLPGKPALLESGVSDEAAQAAEEQYLLQQQLVEAQAVLDDALARLAIAQEALAAAQANEDPEDDGPAAEAVAAAQAEVDAAQARVDEIAAGGTPETTSLPSESDGAGLPEDTQTVPEDAAQAAADAAAG